MKIKTFILTFLLMSCPFLFGQQQKHWNSPTQAGETSMTISSSVYLDDVLLTNASYELAAFCGNELRAATNIETFTVDENTTIACVLPYLTGTASEKITFKLFNGTDEYVSTTTVSYVANGEVGSFSDLFKIHFKSVAKVNGTNFGVVYPSLPEAIAAATAGQTVTLLQDVNLTDILVLDKAITLDGNGKKLTSTAGRAINVSGADGVTIKDLTVNASGERAINIIQNATNVTIENVTATAANYTVNVASSAPEAVVAIKNSNLTGLNVVNVASEEANVTVDGGKLICNDQNANENYAALALNKDAKNGKITATGVTFDIKGESKKAKNGAEGGVITIDGKTDEVAVDVAYIKAEGNYYYAFTSIEAAIEAAKAGETIVLIRDVTASDIITINKAITLDGNGKKLTSTATRAINVDCAGEVTIQNLTVNASGERAFNVIQKAGTLNINNVKATAANYTVNVAGSAGAAKVNVTGSDLTGLNVVNIAGAGAYVTVDNTTINTVDNNSAEGYSSLALNKDAKNGKIIATNVTINITGSNCNDSRKASNQAENGIITINGSTDDVEIHVAYISYNETWYGFSTLEAAIAKAQAGETVTLLRDITSSAIITIDKAITLDGNGKTLTSTAARAINVDCEGEVTIQNLTVNASGERAFNVIQKAGTLNINNVKATAANYTVNVAGSAGAAKVNVTGSDLTGLNVVNIAGAGAYVTVDNTTINTVDNNSAEGYSSLALNKDAKNGKIIATNVTINITGSNCNDSRKASNQAENGIITINGSTDDVEIHVAYISYNETWYGFSTLEAAIAKAQAGETITLIRDVKTANPVTINKSITLDGNNKTLTYTGSNRAIDMPSNADTKLDVTIKNLNVAFSGNYCERGINYNDNGSLTLDNVTVNEAGKNVTYALNLPGSSDNATVTINNSSLTANIALNVWGENATITANNTVFTSVDKTDAENYTAIALNNDGSTVANGTIVTVNGGKIIAEDENGNPSNAVRNSTAIGKVIISESTEVVGKTVNPVAIVTYEGYSQFYSFASLQEAIDKVVEDKNGTVELLTDVTSSEIIKIEGNVVIDLKGKTVTSTAKKAFEVYANATIKNGTIEAAQRCVDTREAVELTLTDVTLIADEYTTYGNPQPLTIGGSENGTKVNMTNVTISATAGYGIITFVKTDLTATNSTIGGYSALYVKPGSDESTFSFVDTDLSGSTAHNDVEGNSFSAIAVRANKVTVTADAESTITATGNYSHALSLGGKFAGEETTSGNNVTIAGNINGNIVSSKSINANTVKVKAEYADELFEDGFVTGKADANGLVKVEGTKVAKIGEEYFASLSAAIAAATNGQTIVLLQDVTENVTIKTKGLTIDGGNNNYTGQILVEGSYKTTDVVVKNVNFINGTAYAIKTNSVKNITVENCTVNNYGYGFLYANSTTTTVVVKDVTVKNANYGMHWVYGSNATLENVTMTDVTYGLYIQNYASKTINVKNSTISSIGIWERKGSSGVQTFKFEGNNTVGTLSTSEYAKYELVETNATLTAPEGSTVTTTVDGHVVKYVDGAYKVIPAVAQIGNEIFASIQDAIDAAQNGDEIVVLQNVTLDADDKNTLAGSYNTFLLVENKTITIDLNGHTIIGDVTGIGKTGSIGLVGIFSINGTGHLTLKDEVGSAVVKIENATDTDPVYALISCFDGQNGSELTINGGSYSLNAAQDALIHSAPSEKVVINNGNFFLGNVGSGTNGQPWIFNANGQNNRNVKVNGGTYNYDINHQYWAFEVNISETLALRNNGNGTWTVVPAEAYVVEQFDRKVGYATLEEAFAVAMEKDFTKVVLVDDVVLENTITVNAGEEIVLDLNGKSINVAKETINCDIYGKLTLNDNVDGGVFTSRNHWVHENAEFIVNSGTVQNIAKATGGFPIYLDGGIVTINGGTVQALNGEAGTSNYGNYAIGGNGTIVMNGGEVKGNWGAINLQAGSATINGGTLKVTAAIGGHALYVAGDATATINGGEFIPSTECGSYSVLLDSDDTKVIITAGIFHKGAGTVSAKSGELSIKGGTFDQDVNAYCAKGYSTVNNGDNTWTVMPLQSQEIVAGWNWYSSYLAIEGTTGLEKLQTALTNGGTIKAQNGEKRYYELNDWRGNLASYDMTKMYMINVSEDQTLDINAPLADATDYTVKLVPNWNWIGYPSNNADVDINVALQNLTPEAGDRIKTQNNGFAEFAFGKWMGGLKKLVPGQGYMYNNKSGETKTFVYNVETVRGTVEANVTAENNYWAPNSRLYPYNMTVTAILDEIGDNYEIAAFVNGEVRGSARPIYIEEVDAYMFFLTIHGENVEEMTFKGYNLTTGEEFELSNVMNYSNDAIVGSINEPYAFTRGTVGLEELSSNFNIYPNPTTTDREINLATTCDKVEVFNALGVKVAEYQNVDTIDALETAGIYVIRVTNNGNAKHCRLVVK